MGEHMSDKKLKNYYDEIYKKGKRDEHFLKYRDGIDIPLDHKIANEWIAEHKNCEYSSVMDFGCGEGEFLTNMSYKDRIGLDYSDFALDRAREKDSSIEYILSDENGLCNLNRSFDVITSFGVLEHIPDPKSTLRSLVKLCSKNGIVIISCPSFLNIRGVIWMTLQLLFDVPMSLSDKHFLTPKNIELFLDGTGKKIFKMQSVDNEVTQGDYFAKDMKKRLTNALSDASLPNDKVELLIDWVDSNKEYFDSNDLTGSNMVYLIK